MNEQEWNQKISQLTLETIEYRTVIDNLLIVLTKPGEMRGPEMKYHCHMEVINNSNKTPDTNIMVNNTEFLQFVINRFVKNNLLGK